jgi:hypothetical protein
MAKLLRDVFPHEFFHQYTDTRAYKLLDCVVVEEVEGFKRRWPGPAKNVHFWWKLEDGRCVGWNENPGRGWSFPVFGKKAK